MLKPTKLTSIVILLRIAPVILSIFVLTPKTDATPIGATECPPAVIRQYLGSGPAPFSHANGLDERDGFLYVVDHPKRILKMTTAGDYVTAWGGQGLPPGSGFLQAIDVAAAPNGTVFVVDWNANEVQKFLSTGTYVTKWGSLGSAHGQFRYPQGIAVDQGNNVYVSDTNNGRVEKFDNDGNYLMTFGSQGTGFGQISGVFGLDVDDAGFLYVAECGTDTHRIQKFAPDGTPVRMWGSECRIDEDGQCVGQFFCPGDVEADAEGRVYVVDVWNYRVQVFDSTGVFLARIGEEGSGLGQFDVPWRLCRDGSGSIYTTERDNNRIIQLRPGVPGCGAQVPLHVTPIQAGNRCSSPQIPGSCSGVETQADNVQGDAYFVYLLATPFETVSLGVRGLQAGIQYESPELSIYSWNSCGTSSFSTFDWPASGSGTTLLWSSACPSGEEVRVAGYFYVGAYGPASLRIVPHRTTGDVRLLDCPGAERPVPFEKCGWVSFGGGTVNDVSGGCNPCLDPCAHGTTSGVGAPDAISGFQVGLFAPNPFRGGIGRIEFTVRRAGRVRASVFNVTGKLVATFLDEHVSAGTHIAAWDGRTATGLPTPDGTYFLKVIAGDVVATGKVLVLRE